MMLKRKLTGIMPLAALCIVALTGCSGSESQQISLNPNQQQASGNDQQASSKILKPMPVCREASVGGPEEVVRSLYKAYGSEDDHESVIHEPEAVLSKYFDGNLVGLMLENQECFKNTREVCYLNVNIMYVAQDWEISDFKVCEMDGGKRIVPVQFRNSGAPQVVNYKLVNTMGGWRISDVTSPMEEGDWSLAATLSGYHDERVAAWAKAQGPGQITATTKDKEPLPHCEPAKAGGPEDLVRSLYEQYPWKGDRIIMNEPKEVLQQYFAKDLAEAIFRDQQDRAKHDYPFRGMPNVIINSDMGDSQDISGFRICAMDTGTKTVKVQFRNGGEPGIVTIKLLDTATGWRISDVFYTEGVRPSEPGQEYDWSMRRALSDK